MGGGGLERFAWKPELELGLIANDSYLALHTHFDQARLPRVKSVVSRKLAVYVILGLEVAPAAAIEKIKLFLGQLDQRSLRVFFQMLH